MYARVMKQRSQERQLARLLAWAQDAATQPTELKRRAWSLAYRQRLAVEEGHAAQAYVLGLQANVIEDEIEARILRDEIRKRAPKRQPSLPPAALMEESEERSSQAHSQRVASPTVVVLPGEETQCRPAETSITPPVRPPVYDGRGSGDRVQRANADRLAGGAQ